MQDESGPTKNRAAVLLGKRKSVKKTAAALKNLRKAVRVRMAKQTPEERKAQAIHANAVRWAKYRAAKAAKQK